MFKNLASQSVQLFAFVPSTGLPKTGDAANITAYVSKDHGTVTVLSDTTAAEMDATNAKGVYVFTLTQAETNADQLTFSAKSSTADVSIVPRLITTLPTTGILAPATAGRTLVVDAAGLADANAVKIGPTGSGTAQTARDLGASVLISSGTGAGQLDVTSGVVKASLAQILGTAITGTAAQLAAAFTKFFNVASPTGTVNSLPDAVPGAAGALPVVDATGSVKVQARLKKNASGGLRVVYQLTDSTNHNPAAGAASKTITRSLDGGAFSAGTIGAIAEIGSGWYYADFAAADVNGNVVSIEATAASCDVTPIVLFMEP